MTQELKANHSKIYLVVSIHSHCSLEEEDVSAWQMTLYWDADSGVVVVGRNSSVEDEHRTATAATPPPQQSPVRHRAASSHHSDMTLLYYHAGTTPLNAAEYLSNGY